MKSQRGQMMLYGALGVGAVMLVMVVTIKIYASRLQSCKTEHAEFVAKVELLGKQAEAAAKLKESQDAKQIKDALSDRDAALKRLHNNTNQNRVPLVPPAPTGSSEICYEQSFLNTAVERFRTGVRSLVTVGDEAQIDAQALIKAWPLKMDTLQ